MRTGSAGRSDRPREADGRGRNSPRGGDPWQKGNRNPIERKCHHGAEDKSRQHAFTRPARIPGYADIIAAHHADSRAVRGNLEICSRLDQSTPRPASNPRQRNLSREAPEAEQFSRLSSDDSAMAESSPSACHVSDDFAKSWCLVWSSFRRNGTNHARPETARRLGTTRQVSIALSARTLARVAFGSLAKAALRCGRTGRQLQLLHPRGHPVISALGPPDGILRYIGLTMPVLLGLGLIFPPPERLPDKPFARLPQHRVKGNRKRTSRARRHGFRPPGGGRGRLEPRRTPVVRGDRLGCGPGPFSSFDAAPRVVLPLRPRGRVAPRVACSGRSSDGRQRWVACRHRRASLR